SLVRGSVPGSCSSMAARRLAMLSGVRRRPRLGRWTRALPGTSAPPVRLAHDASGVSRLLIGLGHSMLQFGGLGVVIVVSSRLAEPLGSGVASLVGFLALVWLLGGVGGVLGISGYLWITNCLGYHGNEAFAALHHMDQKNFLRLHIDGDGALTVYPVGIDRVCRRWRFCPQAAAHEPWLAPVRTEAKPHLIEAPITFRPRPPAST
ncbi:MAG: hypothetical protein ABR540_09565, partial [Acidimicrobiales bacterium]